MKLKKRNREILRKLGNVALPFLVDLLLFTVRIKTEKKPEGKENLVVAFWHGKMLIGWYLFKKKNAAAIVSQSKDGELLTQVLKHWKYSLSRGSSNKGGKEALENSVAEAKAGKNVLITPDGPLGPPQKFKAGAVKVAQKSSKPLLLIGIGYGNAVRLKSWDGFEIPLPFSKVFVEFSEPIRIDENLSYDETSLRIKLAEEELNELTKKAEEIARNN